ncbi:MAG: glycoside hydrolase family 38 C-terminal domain-containing protein [Kiritimatiellae bacterium]|nr:glycoside hydrolase family 38 C-terminal domain-containing protein [Kiritimatiellia bacterium]MDD5522996.1 glycoside hydrolase family 38 C-terminal domain-containing protein [Kiritimatiellia bacterium]
MNANKTVLAVVMSLVLTGWGNVETRAQEQKTSSELGIKSVNLVTSPLIPKTSNGDRHILVVQIDSAGCSNLTVRLTCKTWSEPKSETVASLLKGNQIVSFEVPPLTSPTTVSVQIETKNGSKSYGPFTVQPPKRWTIYLTQHTHTDIGYTRPQNVILADHLRFIDEVLDCCDVTDAYPDDARFRWACEGTWAVREYLKTRPASQIKRLKRRVDEGRIEVTGMMLNMSEIATESTLAASLRPVRIIEDEFGLPICSAMQADVNGAGWCLPDYFSDIGIRYLIMGINQTRSILPFDKPTTFWWESPSGKRVLAFRADHYMTGNIWQIHTGKMERSRPKIEEYLLGLEQRSYPYDRIGVQFSGFSTDNSSPTTIACDLVKTWNEKFVSPYLRLSTVHEFPAWIEKNHGRELPVHRQAWPDWWTDGFGSAARETAVAREAESAMQVNYGLLAIASMLRSPVNLYSLQRAGGIQEDLLFYHEHTYGASSSISDPLAERTHNQWGQKSSFAWTAVKNTGVFREEAFGQVQEFVSHADVPTLVIFNTLNWSRSGLVHTFIDHKMLPRDKEFRILDGDKPVPVQESGNWGDGTYWQFWVNNVPALGYKTLRIEISDKPRTKQKPVASSPTLENAYYKLTVDGKRGAVTSLVDKETGVELVDSTCEWIFGQCIYETVKENNRREMKPDLYMRTTVTNVSIQSGSPSPIWQSLLVSADVAGCITTKGFRVEIRMFETEKRIEFHYAMRKLPVTTPESVYIAFPFKSQNSKMLYEAQGGCVEPGVDQIPGSSSDWLTLQSFLSVRNPDGQIVIGSDQIPLAQLGDINLGKWLREWRVEKPYFYSWVMNNYWFTNFRADQEGEFKWSYYLTSGKDTSRMFATRFGWGSRVPLVARVIPPARNNPVREQQTFSAINVELPNILLVESRPMANGEGIFLHLREIEGKSASINLKNMVAAVPLRKMDELNVVEQPLHKGLKSIEFKPYEVKFIRVSLR